MAAERSAPTIASFAAPYAPADEMLAMALTKDAGRSDAADARIDRRAYRCVDGKRRLNSPYSDASRRTNKAFVAPAATADKNNDIRAS